MPATFWLICNMVKDRSLLDRATSEAKACRTPQNPEAPPFDTTRLCNQPLLQSCYAETLRMCVAVYIIRKPVYEDAQVLDYTIPKNKMMVVSSAMAHMDQRNWNTGVHDERPVDTFWGDRFLTYRTDISRTASALAIIKTQEGNDANPKQFLSASTAPVPHPPQPRFSPEWLQWGVDPLWWWHSSVSGEALGQVPDAS